MDVIVEFYELKYVEKVYLKLNLAQSTKQESPLFCNLLLPYHHLQNSNFYQKIDSQMAQHIAP